jgi:GPI mannosyltransferase 2
MFSDENLVAHPRRALLASFVAWKTLLLLIAIGSVVGPSYDTSTSLALDSFEYPLTAAYPSAATASSAVPALSTVVVARLTRWDAIYFVQIARRGYLFEQEWAFGTGFPTVVSWLIKLGRRFGSESNGANGVGVGAGAGLEALVGVGVSHVAHLLAVLTLYQLTLMMFGTPKRAFLSALLHILSPAGLFLSAPYGESSFAFFSFLGLILYGTATASPNYSVRRILGTVVAGALFGVATAIRSNGILHGILFAGDLLAELMGLMKNPSISLLRLVTIGAIGVGGLCVAAGTIIPQAMAYRRYCPGASETDARVVGQWCHNKIPSIYSHVQDYYW